jgi:prefoldin subunit 5
MRALQEGQKDLADAIAKLNERLTKLEASLPAVLAEAKWRRSKKRNRS